MLRDSEGIIRNGAIPPSLYEDVPKNYYGSSWKHSSKARKSWASNVNVLSIDVKLLVVMQPTIDGHKPV